MKKQNIFKSAQRGSLMVEALALLGLITMVTPVMYKKAAERTTELQDINVATQMRTLNEALDNYVRNNFKDMEDKVPANQKIVVNAKSGGDIVEGIKAYLPAGFDISQSRYFDAENLQFAIQRTVTKDLNEKERSVYTTSVLAPSLKDLKLNRASKIASMVGVNGGIVKAGKVEGTQGAWGVDDIKDWFPGAGDLKIGSLMTISNEAVAEAAQADTSKLLYRVDDGDESKNTMMTNLLMDNVGIEGLTHLLGHGDKLYIGGNGEGGTQETNLIVKGTTEIAKALTVKTGGITVEEGGLDVTGDSVVKGAFDVQGNVTVTGGTLDVDKQATFNDHVEMRAGLDVVDGSVTVQTGDLTVNGETHLGYLHTSQKADLESLFVYNDTELKGKLKVEKLATFGDGTEGTTDLLVNGDAEVTGTLSTGTLDAENLHARSQLTVGGDTPGTGNIMEVKSDSFKVSQGTGSWIEFTPNNFNMEINGGGFMNLDSDEFNVSVDTGLAEISLQGYNGDGPKATMSSGNSSFVAKGAGDSSGYAEMKSTGGRTTIDNEKVNIVSNSSSFYVKDIDIGAQIRGNKLLNLTDQKSTINSYPGRTNYASVELDDNGFNISRKSNGTKISGISMNSEDEFNVNSKNMYVDDNGMALGYNLTASGGDRTVTSENLSSSNGQKVIISRKGYIEIAPPGGTDGNSAGYIKARRLVSDVKYETDNMFHGTDVESERYQYYEVNPAYTSVMNDIKLASRGGARLSDILSDYVIKGIYVADNTYQDNGLQWEYIPIDRGSPSEGVINEAGSDDARTECPDKNNNCKIEVCRTADCVASPWLGYIPRPICPPGYQAVITSNPIRWRMSEVYYLSDAAKGWERKGEKDFGVDEDGNTINKEIYRKIITDSDNTIGFVSDEADGRNWAHSFKYNFHRQNDPLKAYFNLGTETSVSNDDGEDKHTHEASAKPLTFQTNTWLNSSVYPYSEVDGGDILGWHVLMGFIYRPSDYEQLLKDIGVDTNTEDIVWNIFPVYAQEMASIATTYCAFVRKPYGEASRWGSNASGSPVLEYDQLNRDLYIDPIGGVKNDNNDYWINNVNDPSLPYKDAW